MERNRYMFGCLPKFYLVTGYMTLRKYPYNLVDSRPAGALVASYRSVYGRLYNYVVRIELTCD